MDARQLAEYEQRIDHAGTYKSCSVAKNSGVLPKIEPARTTTRWLPHARFDHDAHRGFSCAGCHGMALTSKETSDVLVPGIENCKTCHAPGPDHAESRCFECHTYHDWSKRKDVKPSYTLPGLSTGGRWVDFLFVSRHESITGKNRLEIVGSCGHEAQQCFAPTRRMFSGRVRLWECRDIWLGLLRCPSRCRAVRPLAFGPWECRSLRDASRVLPWRTYAETDPLADW